MKRDLLHVASDAEAALDERLVRRHPLLTLALAAAAGCVAVSLVPRVLRAPGRVLGVALGLSRALRGGTIESLACRLKTLLFG
ncbi:MAG: hypothetical protein HZA52_16365 [Planctomycetes bacterium]|nr:hypothetical protein [Planctomycetota bacterium]